jgi:CheY-like chemotaxis protein
VLIRDVLDEHRLAAAERDDADRRVLPRGRVAPAELTDGAVELGSGGRHGDALDVLRRSEQVDETEVGERGDAALAYLARRADERDGGREPPPALVLLDLNLPGARGSTILSSIRSDKRLRSMPVVVFSTSSESSDVDESYRLGANAYVVKPESAAGFIRTVRAVCEFWLEIAVLPRR